MQHTKHWAREEGNTWCTVARADTHTHVDRQAGRQAGRHLVHHCAQPKVAELAPQVTIQEDI